MKDPARYTPKESELLTAALAYARFGRRVFPVKFVRSDGRCSCGKDPCGGITPLAPYGESAGKHPSTRNGFKNATTNEAQIRAWWRKEPRSHIGLLVLPGELVIDIDHRAGGNDSFKNVMQVQYPLFPDTPHAFTGGKGHHFFFTLPEGPARSIQASGKVEGFRGIEWKANGLGYVVAPPSGHYTGGEYRWEEEASLFDTSLALIPEWLLELVFTSSGRHPVSAPKGAAAASQASNPSWTWPEVVGFFRQSYPEGSRRVATGLPRLVGILASRGHVPEARALDFLLYWQQTHFAPPLAPGDVTAQVQAMYARWTPATDAARGEEFLRFLWNAVNADPAKNMRSKDVLESRIEDEARDSNTSESGETVMVRCSEVARRAAALAGQFGEESAALFPIQPGVFVKGGSQMMRLKDNPLHLSINAGPSDTWQEEGNAQLKRRTLYSFYRALLWLVVEAEQKGAVYLYWRHRHPETVKEDKTYLRNLHSRITRHHGNYVDFDVQYADGWWDATFSGYDDRTGTAEPVVAAQEDFADILAGVGRSPEEYHRGKPVNASRDWQMPQTRTGQWEAIGSREVPDLEHYREIEDDEDVALAKRYGVDTWRASDLEVMNRAPGVITHTRHFLGEGKTAVEMLRFAEALGFWLYPKFRAELEAEARQEQRVMQGGIP